MADEAKGPEIVGIKEVQLRRIVIETDGDKVSIKEMTVSPLELKEICRTILSKMSQ